ncbi:hypothetical protein [Streptomyces sp.]|uniref:hypothetical protein n=1 Tax=Streptomyces sp. TaxID=1931 RepID=UPI002F931175
MHTDQREDRESPVDQWDVLAVAGALVLFAGLWLWVSLGCALTVVGGLVLALGAAGAFNAARPAAAREEPLEGVARRRIGRAA